MNASDLKSLFEVHRNGSKAFLDDDALLMAPEGPLYNFKVAYIPVHGYLSLTVCTFGLFANVLNIIVLTRKEMVSPTNAILTGLAVADMLVMVDYMPFAVHNYIRIDQNVTQLYSYNWTVFTLFHAHFSVVCHTISTWLTVLLAVWRYFAVSYPTESKAWCTMENAARSILATYIVVPICCIPVYLSFTVVPANWENETGFRVDWSEIATRNNELLKRVNFWVFSVGTKLVPCILLTYLSLGLIRVLVEADKRKQRLHENNLNTRELRQRLSTGDAEVPTSSSSESSNAGHLPPTSSPVERKHSGSKGHRTGSSSNAQVSLQLSSSQPSDRTTRMLLAILLLFLVTEFPPGVLVLLSGIIGEKFHQDIYSPLGELMDILALINSAVNFILYCSMSRLFRTTFTKLFCAIKESTINNETTRVALSTASAATRKLNRNDVTMKTTKIISVRSEQTNATYV